ncbi:MAG: TROVE domain-containing protein [Bacteroidales bacterium]|jgi:hypothetical protein|nr:TROVE domain-containing protein [Bacteroidales bacterium]
MAKLNKKTKKTTITKNYEGAKAYKMKPEMELYTRVASCLWHDGTPFYGEYGETERAIIELVGKVDPSFAAKLAVYARERLNLRTVPQVLLVEIANRKDLYGQPKDYVVSAGKRVISRADEVAECLAYQKTRYKGIPNCLRTAMKNKMNSLSEYDVMKYQNRGGMKMVDILNLVRPKPVNDKQRALFGYITGADNVDMELLPKLSAYEKMKKKNNVDEELIVLSRDANATWEFMISKFGNKKEIWESAKLPYMATLRNLRNLIQSGVDMTPHLNLLTNKEAILKSKQFPFRFWSAYKELGGKTFTKSSYWNSFQVIAPNNVLDAIKEALDISAGNMPKFSGLTAIFVDASGSMDNLISAKGNVLYREIAAIMAAAMNVSFDDVMVGVFGTNYKTVPVSKRDSVLSNAEKICSVDVGGSTNAHNAIDNLIEKGINVDRIIVLSDMQCYSSHAYFSSFDNATLRSSFEKYKKFINPDVKLISVDLNGYGTSQFAQSDASVLTIAGWSDKILDIVKIWETDAEDAIDVINKIEL